MQPDAHTIHFSEGSITLLNICLAIIMLGVALDIKRSHFTQLLYQKKAVITGLFAQYFLLPFITVILIYALPISPGMALGMILVAACPGGNVSNFFSMLAKGNLALSVTLSAFSSLLAFVMTPLNFFFWALLVPSLSGDVKTLQVDFWSLTLNMVLILLLPLLVGMLLSEKGPAFSQRVAKPVRMLSMVILAAFIIMAFLNNKAILLENFNKVFWIVLLHNGTGLISAYFASKALKNDEAVNRTVAIEAGIQNSGLGLILIFSFFGGNTEMALVAAWWGIWHLVSGFAFATIMRRRALPLPSGAQAN